MITTVDGMGEPWFREDVVRMKCPAERPCNRRMATRAGMCPVDRLVRTSEQIVEPLLRETRSPRPASARTSPALTAS